MAREAEVLAARLAFLDINLGAGQPSGLEVQRWLAAKGFTGKTVFMTGHGDGHPLVAKAQQLEGDVYLQGNEPLRAIEVFTEALRLQESIVGVGNHVDDGIADGEHVIAGSGHEAS